MKYILKSLTSLILIGLIMASCGGNGNTGKGYNISVQSDVIPDDTLVLTRYSTSDSIYHDTLCVAVLRNGRAELKGVVDVPCMARIRFKKAKKGLSIFLDNSRMYVKVNAENLLDATMKGTRVQSDGIHGVIQGRLNASADYNNGMVRFLGLAAELKRLNASGNDSINALIIRRMRDKAWFDIIRAQRNVFKAIADTTTDIRLSFLIQLSDRFYGKPAKDTLLKSYIKYYGEDYNVRLFRKRERLAEEFRATRERFEVGKKYEDFMIRSLAGDTIQLSDVVGQNKVVLLQFWASWCSPCRAEIPHLKKCYGDYKKQGFEIFAVSVDHSEEAWKKASEAAGINYINASDLRGLNGAISKVYGIDRSGVPMNLLLDHDGRIIQKDISGDALAGVLAEVFKDSDR